MSYFHYRRNADGSTSRGIQAGLTFTTTDVAQPIGGDQPLLKPSVYNYLRNILDDRFEILEDIFSGGQAYVHLVKDLDACDPLYDNSPLRDVRLVMKIFKVNDERAHREIAILRRLTGYNGIVTFMDAGVWHQSIALIMAYADGPTYAEILAERASDLSTAGSVDIWLRQQVIYLQQIAEAIGYAHERGVVHRDLTPANIKICHGRAQLLDWGLARLLNSNGILNLSFEGTPAYAAPEADPASGRLYDQTSDIYCLGELIDEILTGECRVKRESKEGNLEYFTRRHRTAITPLQMRSHNPIPEELARISLKCRRLEISPSGSLVETNPYSDGNALAEDLRNYLIGSSAHDTVREQIIEARSQLITFKQTNAIFLRAEGAFINAYNHYVSTGDRELLETQHKLLHKAREHRQESLQRVITLLESVIALVPKHHLANTMLSQLYRDEMLFCEKRKEFSAAYAAHQRHRNYSCAIHAVEGIEQDIGRAQLQFTAPVPFTLKRQRANEDGVFEETNIAQYAVANFAGTNSLYLQHSLGTYVVELADGSRFPFELGREMSTVNIRPLLPDVLPEGYIYIPEGPYWSGGLEHVGINNPWQRINLPGFLIKKHPVTVREYLSFINALSQMNESRTQAKKLAPKIPWLRSIRTGIQGYTLSPDDPRLDVPVLNIPYAGAEAYVAWRSNTLGRAVKLPTYMEHEKSARGPDGRGYAGSIEFSSRWYHYKDTTGHGLLLPVQLTVGQYADPANGYGDISIYGVTGLYANGAEFCLRIPGRSHEVPVRGARYNNEPWAIHGAALRFISDRGYPELGFREIIALKETDYPR